MPEFFATAPQGTEDLLALELAQCHAQNIKSTRYGARFTGDMETAYLACLWSRIANRILLPLADFEASNAETLYAGVQTIDWQLHLRPESSLAVDFIGTNQAINNTQFGVQKVKDAIVDQLRERYGWRPGIQTQQPDVRVNVYLHGTEATLSIDLAGDSLHRRGYRGDQGQAPLKENLAAAILLRTGWPEIARNGGSLTDPMCGSGTLLIEAALIAGDIAPGLLREYYGFNGWLGHDANLWLQLRQQAQQRRTDGISKMPLLLGSDHDPRAITIARRNVQRAGLADSIRIEQQDLADCVRTPSDGNGIGLVVCNPPYGERLGNTSNLPILYRTLGSSLKRCWPGWRAAVFTGDDTLARYLGLRAHRKHVLFNGSLRCTLLHFNISASGRSAAEGVATDFANRLRKNLKHLKKWTNREDIACYRLYDADLPEYNLAIDLYGNDQRWIHVQEYEAPAGIDPHKAQLRLNAALACIPELLDVPASNIFLKQRRRQRKGEQYEKMGSGGQFHAVREGPARLYVNFSDYLDTGLFLDHRPTRAMIHELAADKRFLNLFGYTGSATVFAVLGGATKTTTVDLSRTYLDWARRNLALNDIDERSNELIQADIQEWLKNNRQRRYDLIFMDPPTYSRSKRMQGTLDIQRDHVLLIDAAMELLNSNGVLLFSTNLRRFSLNREISDRYSIDDITRQTIPPDFARNPRIHQCYRIQHSG